MKRSGVADLPLHGGRVPPWLAARMVALGGAITDSVLHHYGRCALLSRLSDESIGVLRRALHAAKVGHHEKLDAFRRLDTFARLVQQRLGPEADVAASIAHERVLSPSVGGRTVFDDRRPRPAPRPRQGLTLF